MILAGSAEKMAVDAYFNIVQCHYLTGSGQRSSEDRNGKTPLRDAPVAGWLWQRDDRHIDESGA
jgi:hypothetical protein